MGLPDIAMNRIEKTSVGLGRSVESLFSMLVIGA